MEQEKITITQDKTREKLGEGRRCGIGFAFLKRMEGNNFRAVQPISPCKDYLNDVVYSEMTGKPFAAYGLKTKKEDIFEVDTAYLAFASRDSDKTDDSFIKSEVKLLRENLANLAKLVNGVEKLLSIPKPSKFVLVEDNLVFAEISKEWATRTWAISLWSFIVRNAIHAKGLDDAMADLDECVSSSGDSWYWSTIKSNIAELVKSGFPEPDMDKAYNNGVHSYGIYSFNI